MKLYKKEKDIFVVAEEREILYSARRLSSNKLNRQDVYITRPEEVITLISDIMRDSKKERFGALFLSSSHESLGLR